MKILVVEDSRLMRMQAVDLLHLHFPDVQVDTAEDGDMAYLKIKQSQPEIVLLDIMLPGMTGIEILEKIEPLLKKGQVKVLMFSSVDDKGILKQSFELGATDYIEKPIEEIETVARIGSAIRGVELLQENIKTHAALLEQNTRLERLNSELLRAKDRLIQTEKMAAIGQLAAGVAHEINNPIGFVNSNFSTLQGYVKELLAFYETIKTGQQNDPLMGETVHRALQNDMLAFIQEDIPILFEDTQTGLTRVKDIVDSLRSFSRIDMENENAIYDVNQGINDTLKVAKNKYFDVAEVHLSLGDLPDIQANGGKINQVILNILINAVQAIQAVHVNEMGRIDIGTRQVGENIMIQICDNGCGMTEDVIKNLFNPFFTTKPVGEGTGLGMSMSYDIIVNAHGGHFEIESKEGRGSCFKITLPIKNPLISDPVNTNK